MTECDHTGETYSEFASRPCVMTTRLYDGTLVVTHSTDAPSATASARLHRRKVRRWLQSTGLRDSRFLWVAE
jgi:hypothetical protein